MHADDMFVFVIMFIIGPHLYEQISDGVIYVGMCVYCLFPCLCASLFVFVSAVK